jgi:penicillin-binding protein 2
MALYPPGSAFKMVNGLIGLQEEVITEDTRFGCSHGYMFVGCHSHASPLDLPAAVANSCNAYFCQTYRNVLENRRYSSVEEAYTQWEKYLNEFGFGRSLGTDFVNELSGFVPASTYYDRFHGRNRWRALTVISLAIGQGELGTTPLQMANMTAAIANRGYYYTPHIVKGIGEAGIIDQKFKERHYINIDSAHFEPIISGMEGAVSGVPGATARVAAIPGIIVCGKTGTAQNPHGDHHSVFVAVAPKDDPKIAIAVFVENAGYGSAAAAPIASLMIEKYLTGAVSNRWQEQRMLNLNLEEKLLIESETQY